MKEIGSTWGKWDFHVHTPYSILNNQFGFNPFEPEGNYHEEEFDEYVKVLFTKAIENDIVAIGITDYFMIEGYKRIKEKYIDCPEKLEKCFPDEEIRKKVKEIYVFPNIEFRLNTFVGKESVEYHVILSDAISITDIKENFLHKLTFEFDVNDLRCMTMHNIESFGNEIKLNNKESGSPLYVGLKHITISYNVIIESLSIPLFENKHIIAVPVDEDLSRINWDGRDYSIRKNIYKQSQCYLTSNQKTHDWALAKGEEQSRINEFGSIKPCIWGSDAHSYDRMFKPAQDRYCWIQAKPTFEGLLQILYEPATRVFIQKSIPFEKDPHQVIKSIQFNSHEFSRVSIVVINRKAANFSDFPAFLFCNRTTIVLKFRILSDSTAFRRLRFACSGTGENRPKVLSRCSHARAVPRSAAAKIQAQSGARRGNAGCHGHGFASRPTLCSRA